MLEIFKVGFWTSLSTLAKIISYLFIVKIIALYTGPEGLGKMGQFMSLMTIVGVCAGGGISNGIIRYVAEYEKTNPDKIKTILNSGLFITLTFSAFFFIVGLVFSKNISFLLFGNTEYASVIIVLSVAQLCIAINNFLLAIINGYKDVKALVLSNCIAAVINVIAAYFLMRFSVKRFQNCSKLRGESSSSILLFSDLRSIFLILDRALFDKMVGDFKSIVQLKSRRYKSAFMANKAYKSSQEGMLW